MFSETKKAPDEIILEPQLATAVEVLTSKSCSEEGLEEATNLLLQLSWANNITREAILQLLLQGGRELGLTVCQNIRYEMSRTGLQDFLSGRTQTYCFRIISPGNL